MKAVLLAITLSACASGPFNGAWVKQYAGMTGEAVIVHVDFPCQHREPETHGCWNPVGRTIEIRKGLSPDHEACAIRHERAHSRGWVHMKNTTALHDCGPEGTK